MELLMPTGEKTEKNGTLMTDAKKQEKMSDSELLQQIDGKLDTLIAAAETTGAEE